VKTNPTIAAPMIHPYISILSWSLIKKFRYYDERYRRRCFVPTKPDVEYIS